MASGWRLSKGWFTNGGVTSRTHILLLPVALAALLLAGCPHDLTRNADDASWGGADAGDGFIAVKDGPAKGKEAGRPDGGRDIKKPPPREQGPLDRGQDAPVSPTDKSSPLFDQAPPKPDVRLPDKASPKLDKGPPPVDVKPWPDKPWPADVKLPADLKPPSPDQSKPCGNGKIDSGEQCDGTNLGGVSCVTEGYVGGQAACSAACTLVTSGCYKVKSVAGEAVSSAAMNQDSPSVASDGSGYLVVWSDYSPIAGGYLYRIMGARRTVTGNKIGASFVIASSTKIQQRWPSVAFYGGDYLVAWTSMGGSTYFQTWARRVNMAGYVQGTAATQISDKARQPSVAAGGGGFLVAWNNPTTSNTLFEVRAARVTPGLNVLDPKGITVSSLATSSQQLPSAAYTGSDFLVVWEDTRNKSTGKYIDAARVTVKAGSVLDKNGIPVSTAAGVQRNPSVAGTGSGAMVVWEDERGGVANVPLYGAQLNLSGQVLDVTGRLVTNTTLSNATPAIAWGGGTYQVVQATTKQSGAGSDIRGERLNSVGKLTTGSFVINNAAGVRSKPAVARGGAGFLTVWVDNRVSYGNIYTTLVMP